METKSTTTDVSQAGTASRNQAVVRKVLRYAVGLFVALHGVVHLMGTGVYLRLTTIEGLPYETTVLSGAVDLGTTGIAVFGVLWAVAAVGFVVGAGAMILGRGGWQRTLTALAVGSFVLSALAREVAVAGVVVNIAILVGLWVRPRLLARLGL